MARNRFTLPRGAAFDLRTKTWSIPQPKEPRPFFERLLKDPSLGYSIMVGGPNDAYVVVAEIAAEGEPVRPERLTMAEFDQLMRMREGDVPNSSDDEEVDGDRFVTGPGPMIGMTMVATQSPLPVGTRGLVLVPNLRIDDEGIATEDLGFNSQELRSAMWLWDQLDWPEHNLIGGTPTADAQFLLDEGVMRRTRVTAHGTYHSKSGLLNLHETVFAQADRLDPGRWAVGSGGRGRAIEHDATATPETLVVRLANLIPVPSAEVPFEEVLAFKTKRKDELLALREHLDKLFMEIRAAPDQARAWVAAVDALQRQLDDQERLAGESKIRTAATNLEASISVENLAAAAWAALMALPSGNALQVGMGTLGISTGISWAKGKRESSPIDYVLSMRQSFRGR